MTGREESLLALLGDTAVSVSLAVLPLVVIFLVFQIFFLRLPRRTVSAILLGTLLASVGLFLFLVGVSIALLPAGESLGAALGALPAKWLLVPAGLLLGFVTTWGEPAVRILADQVEEASTGAIPRKLVLATICAGVSASVGVGMFRIATAVPLIYLLLPGYALVMLLMWLSDREFVSIAVDSGGVATGPLANSFLLALALGASASVGNPNVLADGLGLVALIALAPILAVMTLGLLVRWKERRMEARR